MGVRGAIDDIQPFAELSQNATTLVYKAYQRSLERFVLLKRLRPEFSADEELSARFQEEARLIARVPHPNIVSVFSYGSDADGAYIVAEYVDGRDLEALIEQGRIPSALALFILSESARGLKAAHDKGILHRDLKPSNILASNEGNVKLSDFGLASIAGASTESGEIRGTLPYLAPELVRGADPDPPTDLFSLGAVFYEMLTGRRAFTGSGPSEILDNVLHHDPRPILAATPGVDGEVEGICARLMAKDPKQRYRDADELLEDAEALRSHSLRRAGQVELQAYLHDPESYVAAAVSGAAEAGGVIEGSDDPDATVGSDEARAEGIGEGRAERIGTTARRWRRAGLFAFVLAAAAGIIYAGSAMLSGTNEPSGHVRSAEETTYSDTTGRPATADMRDTAAGAVHGPSAMEIDPPADSNADGPERAALQETEVVAGREIDQQEGERVAASEDPRQGEGHGERRGDEEASRVDRPAGASHTPEPDEHEEEPVAYGHLEIRVDPAAAVYVNGDSVGTASGSRTVSLRMEAGNHTLTLKNRYFPTYTQQVQVAEEDERVVEVSLFDLVGRLDLRVRPWAIVYVDGDSVGVTPFNPPLILTPGVHQIRLVHERLNVDRIVNVTIEKGRTLHREFDLMRKP